MKSPQALLLACSTWCTLYGIASGQGIMKVTLVTINETAENLNQSAGTFTNIPESFFKMCVAKEIVAGIVIRETPLGKLLPIEIGKIQEDKVLHRNSRLERRPKRPQAKGRGSAQLLAALCKVCNKRQRRRCLKRFCSIQRRSSRVQLKVECFSLNTGV